MSWETLIAVGGLAVAIVTVLMTSRRDTRGDAAERAEDRVMLSSIRSGVDELRVDNRAMHEDMRQLSVQVAEIDQRARSAHHRIDDIQRQFLVESPHDERRGTHG